LAVARTSALANWSKPMDGVFFVIVFPPVKARGAGGSSSCGRTLI
jgi:hypothetical protein